MDALSINEREALSRYLSKLIDDVDKVAALFEKRGADSSLPRAAQANLQKTLDELEVPERIEMHLQARVAGAA